MSEFEYPSPSLFDLFKSGSETAFEEIFDQYYEKLFVCCNRLIRNKLEAQDIVLKALTRLFMQHRNFESLRHVNGFLFLKIRTACLDYQRGMSRSVERKEAFMKNLAAEAMNDELDAEFWSKIIQAIDQLPNRSRQVIVMHYLDGLKYKEIASELDISVKSVENQITYALKKLRNKLGVERLSGVAILLAMYLYLSNLAHCVVSGL